MSAPCAQKEFAPLRKNSGSGGALSENLAAAWWKLFHRASILVGAQGISHRIRAREMSSSVRSYAQNMSPRYSRTLSPSSTPKPDSWPCENLIHNIAFVLCRYLRRLVAVA